MGPRVPRASRQLVSPPPDLRRSCSGYLILDHHFLDSLPFRTKNPRYENCSHFWEKLWFSGVEKIRFKNTFNLCSHIELNTQNPNPIFKITIYYTKYTKNVKIHSNFWFSFLRKPKIHIFQKKSISKWSAFYGDCYGPPLAGLTF